MNKCLMAVLAACMAGAAWSATRLCKFSATVENDRLILVNANPGGMALILR